jgi:chromosome partitioning protein
VSPSVACGDFVDETEFFAVRTFTVINQKGGCGKTTTAINLAAAMARSGCRTLLVDLDPQSHCAAGLGIPEDRLDLDVSDALRVPVDAELNRDRYIWHVSRNLDLLPSRMKLAGIEASGGGLADQDDKEKRLRSVLARLTRDGSKVSDTDSIEAGSRYDVCVLDCPPSIGLISYNAIAAGREVLIPVETSFFSLKGASKQVQTTRSIARRIGMRIQPRLLATMHDPSQPLARDLLDDLRDRFGSGMIPIVVRYDHALKEAASFGQPIDEYDPESMGAEDYRSLCEWLIEHANIDRPEPGEEELGLGKIQAQPTLADPSVRVQIAAANMGLESGGSGGGDAALSRAQELAIRARTMQTNEPKITMPAASALERTPAASTVVAPKPEPLRRSMMPHKPVAVEIRDDRVVDPGKKPSGMEITRVRHLFGVRRTSSGVLFVQPGSIGHRVELAGSFNGWDPSSTRMNLNEALGVYELHLKLSDGTYSYKLVVDGQWVLDAYNPDLVDNGMGGRNNRFDVGPSGA